MKIKVVMPDRAMERATLDLREKTLQKALSPGVGLSVDCIKRGADELDCNTDEAFAASEMVKEAIIAEKDGFDAFVIYCFSDVGIDAIRENVSIPVIGPGELAISVAGLLCNRFTVITTEKANVARTYRRLMKYPVAREKMTSVRPLDIPVKELAENPQATKLYLERVSREAVNLEKIDGVILGCLGMADCGAYVEERLPVRVFDPAFLGIAFAELCARLSITHCESVYPKFLKQSQVGL